MYRWPKLLLGLFAIALPCSLLSSTKYGFYYDWPLNCYFIGYFGEYLRQRGIFPASIDTEAFGGLAFPVYYGFLYYRIAGVVSAITNAHVALRVLIVVSLAVQF